MNLFNQTVKEDFNFKSLFYFAHMPIPRKASKEFFIESKDQPFLRPDIDEPGPELNILGMLLRLLTSASRHREFSPIHSIVSYTIIQMPSDQTSNSQTLVLIENRISQQTGTNDWPAERSFNDLSVHLSTPEDHD